jgi:hypothetical protein
MSGMKAKSIKSVITRKMNQWVETIEDENLRSKVAKSIVVTGGCIASMLQGEPVNDFDVYLRDYETAVAVADYYVGRFTPRAKNGIPVPLFVDADASAKRVKIVAKSAGIASEEGTSKPYQYFESHPEQVGEEYVADVMDRPDQIMDAHEETEQLALQTATDGKPKYRPVFLTSNAITLSDKIQIVLRFQGEPDDIHANYDFVHCTSYWTSWDEELVLKPEAMEAILAKELRYVGSKYPVCSVVRLRKFIARGWRINAGQILKMAMQISALDLTDLAVLEDQLTGVDTAYFLQLIEKLKEKDPTKVNTAYLVEIINRMF